MHINPTSNSTTTFLQSSILNVWFATQYKYICVINFANFDLSVFPKAENLANFKKNFFLHLWPVKILVITSRSIEEQ